MLFIHLGLYIVGIYVVYTRVHKPLISLRLHIMLYIICSATKQHIYLCTFTQASVCQASCYKLC